MPVNEGEAERRGRLIALKLRALVRDHIGDDSVPEAEGIGIGAALRHGDAAWVLLDDRPEQRLGAALAWALRAGARSLDVIAESGSGIIARRAGEFEFPIRVWTTDGRALVAVDAEPVVEPAIVPTHHLEFSDLIVAGGAVPTIEHGVLFGEVRGLEVCRVVDDEAMGVTRLEVGVGAHDREAFQMMHGDVPTVDSLARIVDAVLGHRSEGASPHPLNRIGVERFMRWRLEEHPELVDAASVVHAQPPVPRPNLKDVVPCVASGLTNTGEHLTIVCSAGVDLDLIPYAADARLATLAAAPGVGGGTRLVLVVPSRDRIRVTDEIAGQLSQSVEFVSLD